MSATKNSIHIKLPKKQSTCFSKLPWGEPFTYMGELLIKTSDTVAFSLTYKKSVSFACAGEPAEINPVNLLIEVLA